MNENAITIRRALLSVSDKTGIADFARFLHQQGVEILSTGGTAAYLREQSLPVTDVASLTQFPEIMDGRVKTLHPVIHGGILGLRDRHEEAARTHGIDWIDLVVVNLYPFAKTVANSDVTLDDALENVDIGGPSMIRSAAKNTGWVGVVVDPADYPSVMNELQAEQALTFATRQRLSARAFSHTAHYDAMIAEFLLADRRTLSLEKSHELRYGENPHQTASAWQLSGRQGGVLGAESLQGKPLSYNNLVDADAAFSCVREFLDPACVIVKHATPCGVAVDPETDTVFSKALSCDPVSAFGGVAAFNRTCTEKMAEAAAELFLEVLLAPTYTPGALAIFRNKPNLRVLQVNFSMPPDQDVMKHIDGGLLIQSRDLHVQRAESLQLVTQTQPTPEDIEQLLFAVRVVKHVKSNAIVIARQHVAVGIGGGQVSRVDAVDHALRKAGARVEGAVLASDAFFPFRDSIDLLAGKGIRAVVQPGGSRRDAEVIAACDAWGIAMVFTGVRSFRH